MKEAKDLTPIYVNLENVYDINKIIDYIYEKHFKLVFMDSKKRTKFNNKFIYLEMDFIKYKPERFWHLISFNPDNEKYTVNPCVNSKDDILTCNKIDNNCSDNRIIPDIKKLEKRCECMYRARRVNWINPIIQLANIKDKNVRMWEETEIKDKKEIKKSYIRYQNGVIDYLIILLDRGKNYKFITAYPVVHNGTKDRLNKKYMDYKISKNKKSRSQQC